MSVRVAPREITDYVQRAARVGGCDPSDADLLAAAVTFAEIHGGGGVAAFVGAADVVGLTAEIRSIDVAALAVLDVGRADQVEHALASPVPRELVGMAVDGWRRHGVAVELGAARILDRVSVRHVEPDERGDDRPPEYRTALAEGVDVDGQSWARLIAKAAEFLVAESLLDALSD